MKRVSFKAAQALKDAGYPQDQTDSHYTNCGELIYYGIAGETGFDAPTYLDVWLWLWREKMIKLMLTPIFDEMCNDTDKVGIVVPSCYIEADDPEEVIINAIEFLVENNLIK